VRYIKRYLIIILVLVLILLCLIYLAKIKYNTDDIKSLAGSDNISGNEISPGVEDSNRNEISITVNNKEISSANYSIYVNEEQQLMLPVKVLRDLFNCSVHIYKEDSLLIEKRSNEILLQLNKSVAVINDEELRVSSPMIYNEGEYYVPAQTVLENLNFKYTWNADENKLTAIDRDLDQTILPVKYDLREKKRAAQMKDQGDFGTCWAFAALSAMESSLLPEEAAEYSPDHMSIKNSFFLRQTDGGEYTMGMAYLTAWQGPVYEADDPYGDSQSPEDLTPVKHVQEIQIIEEKNFEKIKEAVFKYGGVQSSIYSVIQNEEEKVQFYNEENYSYCYIGTQKPNHDITIIGWDDSYPKENFITQPESDGAFICQNSWGTQFGDNGVFYISYHDVNIGIHNVVYTAIENSDNYDNIYQADLCGWVGQLGYNKDSMYAANVYKSQKDESLKAAGFYATGKDTEYEIYITKDFKDTASLGARTLVAEGKLGNAGFYTIDFNREINVLKGQKYAVILYIKTPGSIRPIAVEYQADEFTSLVDLSDGEGYISARGITWVNVEEAQKSNLCIKVYSNDRE